MDYWNYIKNSHELRLMILALDLIVNEMYTKDELQYLILQDNPLSILYEILIRYIQKARSIY